MAKLIHNWEELEGLESEHYKIELVSVLGEKCCGRIVPKIVTKENNGDNYFDHHVYLSTHTFYGSMHQYSTEILQRFGFDVEIDNWDKVDGYGVI